MRFARYNEFRTFTYNQSGFKNEKNVKIEVVLREEKLQDIVEEISRTMFSNFAIILYVSDVNVVRTEKFV